MNSLTVATDRTEYSRYPMEPGDTRNVIQVYLTFNGALSTDVVTVTLVRTSGYVDGGTQVLATQTIDCTSGQANAAVYFPLDSILEQQPYNPPVAGPSSNLIAPASRDNQLYRGTAGSYLVQAAVNVGSSPPGPTAQSPPFRVTIIPSDELRHLWLRGVSLQALDVVAPLFQPQVVTGVRIRDTGQSTFEGVYALGYTASSPPTLSWAGGAPQIINGTARQTLVCQSANGQSYVVLDVNPWQLPSASVTENILIGGSQFTDADLQKYVDYATHTLESAWYFFAEPHTSDTDPMISQPGTPILQNRGIVGPGYHVEQQEVPMTYRRPRDFSHWMSFSLPRRQIQAVYYLFGYFNQSQAVSIGRDWIVFDPVTGTLELVPDNGAVISWQFYGAAINNGWPPAVMRDAKSRLNSGNGPTRRVA